MVWSGLRRCFSAAFVFLVFSEGGIQTTMQPGRETENERDEKPKRRRSTAAVQTRPKQRCARIGWCRSSFLQEWRRTALSWFGGLGTRERQNQTGHARRTPNCIDNRGSLRSSRFSRKSSLFLKTANHPSAPRLRCRCLRGNMPTDADGQTGVLIHPIPARDHCLCPTPPR
jgi:hypothetical protein